VQICGLALILAGCSFVLFLVLHPYGELAGAQAPLSVRWFPAHTFHFLGALFALFGLLGLGARQREAAGRLASSPSPWPSPAPPCSSGRG